MIELVRDNWILVGVALLIGLFVAWWVLVGVRRTRVDLGKPGETGPAKRNQALIDSSPVASAAIPPLAPAGLAGAGEAVQALAEPAASGDDLTRIKGLGPKLADQLRAMGVTRFAQIAAWDDAEIDRVDAKLGRFQGRIRRDDWPAQARLLGAGDEAGYESRFGKL